MINLKSYISFTMALLLLYSSMGFSRVTHTCNFTKIAKVSIGESKHCCDEQAHKDGINQGKCCDIEKEYVLPTLKKVDTTIKFNGALSPDFHLNVFHRRIFLFPPVTTTTFLFPQAYVPPFGRSLLSKIQLYRI